MPGNIIILDSEADADGDDFLLEIEKIPVKLINLGRAQFNVS